MAFWEDYGNDFGFLYGPVTNCGNIAGMHIHPHYEVLIVTTVGKQTACINGTALPEITQPSLNVFAPFSMHQINFDVEQKMERFVFYFGGEMTERLPFAFSSFDKYSQSVFSRFDISPELLQRLRPYLDEARKRQKDKTFMKLNFLTLFNMILADTEPSVILNPSENLTGINEIIQYMVKHCKENVTAEEVCREFYISRSKLNKMFDKHLGTGFHSLFNEMKLSQAFYMLKYDATDIKGIARSLGFEKETYFYTFFKKATGMTPLQYRRKYASHALRKQLQL